MADRRTSDRPSTRCSRPTPRSATSPRSPSASQLLAWVTAAVYREPGLLAKEVTTLDVLSRGRAMLGIGAAWNEEECGRARPALPVAPPSASSGSRRPCRSACRCGATATSPMPASTTSSAAPSTRRSRCSGPTRRSSSAAAARRRRCGSSRSTPRPATSSTAPTSRTSSTCCADTARPSAATTTRSRRPSWDPSTRARTARTSTPPSSTCASLAGLGVTHVQMGVADGSRTDWLELIGERIIPEAAKL